MKNQAKDSLVANYNQSLIINKVQSLINSAVHSKFKKRRKIENVDYYAFILLFMHCTGI